MKHIIISTFLSVFFVSSALADWIEDFDVNLDTQGIEVAVEKALEEGRTPEDIVNKSMLVEGLNPQNVLKALYCEGVAGDDVKGAADGAGISELILLAAFDKSVVECGDKVADSQAYTPINQRISFAGLPSPGNSNIRTASPNTFTN